jgi:TPR repeat protein
MNWLLTFLIFLSSLCLTSITLTSAEHRTYRYDELLSQDLYLLISNENFVIPKERFLLKEDSVNDVYNRYSLRDISSYAEARDLIDLAESGDAVAQFELYLNYKYRDNDFLKYNKDEAKKWLSASDENGYYWAQVENFNIYETSLLATKDPACLSDDMLGSYHYMMYVFKQPYKTNGSNVKDNTGRTIPMGRAGYQSYIPRELDDKYSYNKEGGYVFAFDTDLKVQEDLNYFTSGDKLLRSISTLSYPYKTKTERIYLAVDFTISKLQKDRIFLKNVIRRDRQEHLVEAAKYSPKHYCYVFANSLLDSTKGTAHNQIAIDAFKAGAIAGDPRCVLALGMIYHIDVFTERDLEAAYCYYIQYLCMNQKFGYWWGHKYQSILNEWGGGGNYKPVLSLTDFNKYIDQEYSASDKLNTKVTYLFSLVNDAKERYYDDITPKFTSNLIELDHVLDVVLIDNEIVRSFDSFCNTIRNGKDNFDRLNLIKNTNADLNALGLDSTHPCATRVMQRLSEAMLLIENQIDKEEKDLFSKKMAKLTLEAKAKRAEQTARYWEKVRLEEAKMKKLRDLSFTIGSKVVAPLLVVFFLVWRWYGNRAKACEADNIPKEFFFKAEEELNSGNRDKVAYLKAEVLAGGDKSLTRLKYIEARASELYQDGKSN